MAMKILKGNVKYKDRSDIVCTYAELDNGSFVYFMDSSDTKKFINGNRIATTLLVEAVDPMVKTSNIGVIDSEGNVVIPFENKSIKPVDENVIIVESAVPVSESVVEAVKLRSDPLSATKLVSTSATIKEKINQQMGSEGRFLFNDQFSEATLCDINGNNLVNGEKYSFIAMSGNKLYFCKNTVDSSINEFSLIPSDVQNNEISEDNSIDLSKTIVDENVVEEAFNNENIDVNDTNVVDENTTAVSEEVIPTSEVDETTDTNVVGENTTAVSEEVVPTSDAVETTDTNVVDENTTAVSEEVVPTSETGETPDTNVVEESTTAVSEEVVPTSETGETPDTNAVEESTTAVSDEVIPTSDAVETPDTNVVEESTTSVGDEVIPTSEADETTDKNVVDENTTAVSEEVIPASEAVETTDTNVDEESTTSISDKVISTSQIEDSIVDGEDEKVNDVITDTSDENDIFSSINIDSTDLGRDVMNNNENNSHSIIDSSLTQKSSDNMNFDNLLSEYATDTDFDLKSKKGDSELIGTSSIRDDKLVDDDISFASYGFDNLSTGISSQDSLMVDVAKSMGKLIKQNKTQKELIQRCNSQIEDYESKIKILSSRYKEKSKQNELLSSRMRDLGETVDRLESNNHILEQKIYDLNKIISAQENELKSLRPQLEGKKDLVKLLADAKILLGDNDTLNYNDETSYYGRAA